MMRKLLLRIDSDINFRIRVTLARFMACRTNREAEQEQLGEAVGFGDGSATRRQPSSLDLDAEVLGEDND